MQDPPEHTFPVLTPVQHAVPKLITTRIRITATVICTDLRIAARPIPQLPVLPIPLSAAEVVVAEVLREAVVFHGQAGNL